MAQPTDPTAPTRRDVLRDSSCLAATSLLAGGSITRPPVGGQEEIRIAVVGCGGRGSGAARNALMVKRGPTKLVAMADVFEDRMASSHGALAGGAGEVVRRGVLTEARGGPGSAEPC